MNRKIWAAIGGTAILAASALPAFAATEGTVSATVTVQNISITVSDGGVAYGALAVNTSKDTTSGDLNDTQEATNNGNVTEDFFIRGVNSAAWALAGAAGSDQYVHGFCTTGAGSSDPCDTTPSYTPLTTGNQNLQTSVATTGTKRFDLKITTPTSSSSFAEQDVSVTVVATAT